jgi:hypothetical protein
MEPVLDLKEGKWAIQPWIAKWCWISIMNTIMGVVCETFTIDLNKISATYQINATFYSALGEDDQNYWYLGPFKCLCLEYRKFGI